MWNVTVCMIKIMKNNINNNNKLILLGTLVKFITNMNLGR